MIGETLPEAFHSRLILVVQLFDVIAFSKGLVFPLLDLTGGLINLKLFFICLLIIFLSYRRFLLYWKNFYANEKNQDACASLGDSDNGKTAKIAEIGCKRI